MRIIRKKNISILIFIILFFLLLINNFRLTENFSLSIRFGDEDAHIIGGYFITKGKKLYHNISTNHQPFVYFFSTAWQKITRPSNLYLLIKRHREFIFFYSTFWLLIYLRFFGVFGSLFFLGTYEIYKYEILGNLLLQEVIALYPLVFIIGIFVKCFLDKREINNIEIIFTSISFFITAFSLLSHWLALIIFLGCFLVVFKEQKQKIILFFLQFLVLLLFLFIFINPLEYFKETIIYNKLYFMPEVYNYYQNLQNYLKVFYIPFLSLFAWPKNSLEWFISGLLVSYLVVNLYLLKQKKISQAIFLLFFLILTNTRVNSTKGLLYGGFHLIPWLGSLTAIVVFSYRYLLKSYKIFLFLILCGMVIWLNIFPPPYHKTIKNKADEYFIFYQQSEDAGKEIAKMTKESDTIISLPTDTLVYFTSRRNMGSRQLEFYGWQYKIPEYYEELKKLIKNKKIKLIYLHPNPAGSYEVDPQIYQIIKQNYQEIKKETGRYFLANY